MTGKQFTFAASARLASSEDNVAIAIQDLAAGTVITYQNEEIKLTSSVLLGHRFAIRPIPVGAALTSWGQPFGIAIKPIHPGDYLCNAAVLESLKHRSLSIKLPEEANFADEVPPFVFDETTFSPPTPLPRYANPRTFMGYPRPGTRGTGTRNHIILLGTTSLTAGFVSALEKHLKPLAKAYPNTDGVVAVAHTEGGHHQPNNRELLLRTLAGFMVHPNVGAVLAVDRGDEAITNTMLKEYMLQHNYPLADVPHQFMSLSGSFMDDLATATTIVKGWLDSDTSARVAMPLSGLKIGLQCGGSDAFSGISGNPLAGWVVKEVICHGGSGNLAETDELVNAENYTLSKVRDVATAKKFLAMLDRFKTWAGWHGHSIFGNPSGGNLLRGLYNIYLKSLGAAAKRHPDIPLDYVIDYAEPMQEAGFYFMDSPGNDLESTAGQVGAGCNLILFVTGNGSITNFPFVPTLKIMTTSQRFQLLSREMDVNAGMLLEDASMEVVGSATFDLTCAVASGQLTKGEQAGHAQTQIWRDWRLTSAPAAKHLPQTQRAGLPLTIRSIATLPEFHFEGLSTSQDITSNQVGLILPTSLCAGQVAHRIAESLNDWGSSNPSHLSRFVALVHTEGCGSSGSPEYINTMLGYLSHPLVAHCLLLEHGCEVTHSKYFRSIMVEAGWETERFGWASIQLDGGIEAVEEKVMAWFQERIAITQTAKPIPAGLESVKIGLVTASPISDEMAMSLAQVSRTIVSGGGTVVIPQHDNLLASPQYLTDVLGTELAIPTLSYAQTPNKAGLHIMETPLPNYAETLTGLGATGIEVILVYSTQTLQSHPMIPTLYVTSAGPAKDFDLFLEGDADGWPSQLLGRLAEVLSRTYIPQLNQLGNVHFQVTRGLLGISL